jgi:hypothetical protein
LNRAEMKKCIKSLNADEAARVLNDLLDNNPDLMKKAYDTAMKIARDVNADVIMDDVFNTLNGLDDISSYCGSTRYGYVEPSEAAWKVFYETLNPFIDEMKKAQKLALPAAAKAHCIGIIRGLWKFEEEATTDFAGWAEDAPEEYVDAVVKEWKKGKPGKKDIAEVMSIAKEDRA